MPWMTRMPMIIGPETDDPTSVEAIVKMASPARNILFLPRRSPKRPPRSRKLPKVSE